MHYPDLSYLRSGVLAVGWLEPGTPYAKGPVEKELFEKLAEMLKSPWQQAVSAGVDTCNFCRFTRLPVASAVLTIPGEGCLFQSPALIAHFIDAHEYAPPNLFIKAALKCPPMRSMDYLKALRKNAPAGFLAS